MRTLPLSGPFFVDLFADEPEGVIGDIKHIVQRDGASVRTPVGHFAAIPEKALPEQPARWRVETYFRNDIQYNPDDGSVTVEAGAREPHYPGDLAEQLADLLLQETQCTNPMILNIWEGINTSFVARGQVTDED